MTRRRAVAAGLLLVAAGAWLGLAAREAKDDAGDLELVPASARLVVSARVADLWESELGKELREAMAKEAAGLATELKDITRAGPEGLERATYFIGPTGSTGYILRGRKPLDVGKFLQRHVPDAKIMKVGGSEMHVSGSRAVFAKGKVLLFGGTEDVRAALAREGKLSEALKGAISRIASGKHSLVGYMDSRLLPRGLRKEVPPPLVFLHPLLGVKEAVGWADLGPTAKFGGRLTFANRPAAARCEKSLLALRALGVATLAGLEEKERVLFKGLPELASEAEKALEGASLKRDGAAIILALSMKLPKAPMVALLKSVADEAGFAAARTQSAQNLRQIGLAMHSYHDANGLFPAQAIYSKDGKPLLSWRVTILPYIEQDALYKKFKLDEPWDSPHNKKLIPLMPRTYMPIRGKPTEKFGTYYQVCFGPGAAFEGKRGLKFSAFSDGLSNTMMVVEAGQDGVWTKPEDVTLQSGKKLPKLGGMFEQGFNALMGDGSVRFVSRKVSAATLQAAITRAGGEPLGSDF